MCELEVRLDTGLGVETHGKRLDFIWILYEMEPSVHVDDLVYAVAYESLRIPAHD